MQTIHLQGLGSVEAKRADELIVGDLLHYNYTWGQYVVASLERKGKSILITERNVKTGQTHTRRRLATTLVGASSAERPI